MSTITAAEDADNRDDSSTPNVASAHAEALSPATLYIVATPIGNLGDLSERARAVLRAADCVCAEDTRHSGPLLNALGARGERLAVHEHNEASRAEAILSRLRQGRVVALISDAGTPAVSDPGARTVAAIAAAGFRVVPIPGPCAAITALSAAGLPEGPFWFEGFLPQRGQARRKRLMELLATPAHIVLYESGNRVLDLLEQVATLKPEAQLVIARELTKRFETILRGSATELQSRCQADEQQQRGELVVIIARELKPQAAAPNGDDEIAPIALITTLLTEVGPAAAAKLAAKITGVRREVCYRAATEINRQ